MTHEPNNPYVGTRAFHYGEALYGRDNERDRLCDLIIAERIVLLYSPSGAGKTSLIQAALIPELERQEFLDQEFLALPIVRLYHQPPPGAGHTPINRYLYSTLLSLSAAAPEEPDLLHMSDLAAALTRIAGEPTPQRRQLLIFDQFEELLTLDPTDEPAKRAFLQQLGRALAQRWALFAMREDYLAALDPYKALLPTHLRTTMRLDRLRLDQAEQAIRMPAQERGVSFAPEAIARLVDDLRQTRVVQADGETVVRPGPYVEPVQLQVVCLRLWDEVVLREPRRSAIELDDLRDYADLDAALADHYDDSVARVAAATQVDERAIREWIGGRLITREGLRSQVVQAPGAATGLSNAAMAALIEARIVRDDQRYGATWYELAHERLIDPIRRSNETWFEQHLSPWARRAQLWERSDRPESLLLRGDELAEGERWAAANPDAVGQRERDFLRDSRRLEDSARQRTMRSLALTSVLTAMLLLAMLALTLISLEASNRQLDALLLARRAAKSLSELRDDPPAALAAAICTVRSAHNRQWPIAPAAEEALRYAIVLPKLRASLAITDVLTVYAAVYLGDGPIVAVEPKRDDGVSQVVVWSVEDPAGDGALRQLPPIDATGVRMAAFSPDGTRLAIVENESQISVWDVQRGTKLNAFAAPFRVTSVRFLPDGNTLSAAGDGDDAEHGQIMAWDLATGAESWALGGAPLDIVALAFRSDGKLVAAGGSAGEFAVWYLDDAGAAAIPVYAQGRYPGEITFLGFNADESRLTVAGDDATARSWDGSAILEGDRLEFSGPVYAQSTAITAAAYSLDGSQFAAVDPLGRVRVWNLFNSSELADLRDVQALSEEEIATRHLVYSPDSTWLLSVADDGQLALWDVAPDEVWTQRWQGAAFTRVAYSPSGELIAVGEALGTIHLYRAHSDGAIDASELWRSDTPGSSVVQIAFSKDEAFVTAITSDGQVDTLRRWPVRGPGGAPATDSRRPLYRIAPGLPALLSPDGDYVLERLGNALVLSPSLPGNGLPVEAEPILPWRDTISALAFDDTGAYLAVGHNNGAIELWNIAETSGGGQRSRLIQEVQAPAPVTSLDRAAASEPVTSIAVGRGPDGRQIIVAGMADGRLVLWDDTSGAGAELSGHTKAVTGVAVWSDDGRLASTGDDGQVLLWTIGTRPPWWQRWPPWRGDGTTTLEPVRLPTAELASYAIAFRPDGRYFATADANGELRVYALELKKLLEIAERAAGGRPSGC